MSADPDPQLEPRTPGSVPAWVYRLDVEPPARHDGWRRAIRILHVTRGITHRQRRSR